MTNIPQDYAFVLVGGGSAGAIVAARLALNVQLGYVIGLGPEIGPRALSLVKQEES